MKKYNKYMRLKDLAFSLILGAFIVIVHCLTMNVIANAMVTVDSVQDISNIEIKSETIQESTTTEVKYSITKLYGGVSEYIFNATENVANSRIITEDTEAEVEKLDYIEDFGEPWVIRCTGYCDYGYTKSGQYVRYGIIAGKEEWLGKTAVIYRYNEDGTIGELIGYYEFLDTGYGINGSLVNGTSVDIWHPSEDAVWDWVAEYGDYVYIQIVDMVG